ncbi:hypothetical protein FRB99_004438 [Tulasnella sp. 403]|nr:hypothetical protein FRB99_004438 [Tulasnella sp. 403]
MLALPRLPLPGTLDLQRHFGVFETGSYVWSPFDVDPTIAKLEFNTPKVLMSHSPSPPAPSGSSLKGQRSRLACLRCRTKKTKCDGNTPCNQCIKIVQECSYEERRKPELSEKALSEKLAILQSRYDALSPANSSRSGGSIGSPESTYSTLSSGHIVPGRFVPQQAPIQAIITTELRDHLLRIALAYIPRCSFSLDAETFIATLQGPESQQPHASLINALMLMGSFYAKPSQLPPGTPPQEYFVQQIRATMMTALSDVDRIVHYIAASSMLAFWLIQNARFLEGQYEISASARLALDCGLHQIDEAVIKYVLQGGTVPPHSPHVHGSQTGILGPPTSTYDLETRIAVFWGVFLMDKLASLVTGLPPAFDDHSSNPHLRITTVWPRHSGTYGGPWHPNDFTSLDDLMGFLQVKSSVSTSFTPRIVPPPPTITAASVQGMALLLRGIRLSCTTPQTAEEAQGLQDSLVTLNHAITRFTSQMPRDVSLPAIERQGSPHYFGATTPLMAFLCLAEVRCAAYVIIIKMHQAAETLENFQGGAYRLSSRFGMGEEKRLNAAKATTAIAQEVFIELNKPGCDLSAKDGLCVIMGFLWTSAAVVYIERIAKLRQGLGQGGGNSFAVAGEIQGCMADLGKTLDAIRALAKVFPVLDLQVQKLDSMIKESIGN